MYTVQYCTHSQEHHVQYWKSGTVHCHIQYLIVGAIPYKVTLPLYYNSSQVLCIARYSTQSDALYEGRTCRKLWLWHQSLSQATRGLPLQFLLLSEQDLVLLLTATPKQTAYCPLHLQHRYKHYVSDTEALEEASAASGLKTIIIWLLHVMQRLLSVAVSLLGVRSMQPCRCVYTFKGRGLLLA